MHDSNHNSDSPYETAMNAYWTRHEFVVLKSNLGASNFIRKETE